MSTGRLEEPKSLAAEPKAQLFLALSSSSFTQGQFPCETDHELFGYHREFYHLH